MQRNQFLDDALRAAYADPRFDGMPARDLALARAIVTTTLRRYGQLSDVINQHLTKPLPVSGRRAHSILLTASAQLLFLSMPAHAVIDTAVDLSRTHRASTRFANLINAVLRRVSEAGPKIIEAQDVAKLNVPEWLLARWTKSYGRARAREIAIACLSEPALDITVRSDASAWAERLNGHVLPTGSVRRGNDGRIDRLDGFDSGDWWVQDAAAAIPARLIGAGPSQRIADLCAAPGGKTAQLAMTGASVTAVDVSDERLKRLSDNLRRLRLSADTQVADAAAWSPREPFDAVLVDAPCTATGTIRRHPDILHLRREADIAQMAALQTKILDCAANAVRPGGLLVYCTCSLEVEEGEDRIAAFLAKHEAFRRVPVTPQDVGNVSGLISSLGDLRTLPFHLQGDGIALPGLDGFYAARLQRC